MATGRVPTTANSPLTAKGDLFGYSTTQARVAVGNDGETLVADSSQATGLRYTAGTVQANPVLNSAMQVWQRGTSIAGSSSAFAADRWQAYRAVAGSTYSRQLTNDTTNLPFIQYATRVQRDSGNTSTAGNFLIQNFESINSIPFAGKTVTWSFYARAGANYSPTSSFLEYNLATGTGTDQNLLLGLTGRANPILGNVALTTTWQRFSFTATLASNVTQIVPNVAATWTGTAGANDWFEITGVQIDVGSVALPFRTYAATIQGELAACQRYYWQWAGGVNGQAIGMGSAYSASQVETNVQFPVQMRTTPSFIQTTGTDYYAFQRNGGTDLFNSWTANMNNDKTTNLYNNTNISSTAGQAGTLFTGTSASQLAFSAEL